MTVEYKDDKGACVPQRVHTVLISAHHSKNVTKEELQGAIKADVYEKVVKVRLIKIHNVDAQFYLTSIHYRK